MNKISWSFRGTFSANNIPKFKDNFFSLIVNLSNEGETGDTWDIGDTGLTLKKQVLKTENAFAHSLADWTRLTYLKKVGQKGTMTKTNPRTREGRWLTHWPSSLPLEQQNWGVSVLCFRKRTFLLKTISDF